MDIELQTYYENLLDLFSSSGWKDFIEDIQSIAEPMNEVRTIQSEKELWLRRGQVDILDYMLNYENMIKEAYDAQNV